MSEYRDSLDRGADNTMRLGQDVAERLIKNHRNKKLEGNNNSNHPDHNQNPLGHSEPSSTANTPDTDLGTNGIDNMPFNNPESMGGLNIGADAAGVGADIGAVEAAGAAGVSAGTGGTLGSGMAEAGAAAGGAEAGSAGAAAGTGAAGTGAAGAGSAAGASGAAGGSSAGGTAASTGGTAAGGSGCAVVGIVALIVIIILFIIFCIICLISGIFTYNDSSVLSKESTSQAQQGVVITADTLNVRSAAGTSNDKIGKVYKNGTYTYLGESKDKNGTVWYKIQYTADTAGWISSDYADITDSGGGNSTVELANSVLVYLAEDCSDSIASAKSDVKKKSSAYGGKIKLSGSSEMGGPEGGSATSEREYEYFIDDGGITASYNDTSEGSMEIDVPYIMAAFSVYMERNNDVLDLTTASSSEVWDEFEKVLDDIFSGTHTYKVTSKNHTYKVPNPDYGEVIDTQSYYDSETGQMYYDYTYDTRKTIEKTGKYYTYTIQREEVEVMIYNYFSGFTDEEWELVDAKSVFIAQLLYEIGGLCYTSTFDSSDNILSSDDNYDIEIKYDGGTGRFAWAVPSCKRISSPFGMRWHPTKHIWKKHKGIDIPGAMGSDVIAAADGEVIKLSKACSHNNGYCCNCGGGYGRYIYIKHSDGYVTRYAHLKDVKVKVGQKVVRGQVIATVGTTGTSTGPHLHFEIRKNNTPIDPEQFY